MGVREFRDDDRGYLAWLAGHPDGYVINIGRSPNVTLARVHHASCRTISGQNPRGGPWTGPYVKICAEHLAELEQWATNQLGQVIPSCGICNPARRAALPMSFKRAERAVAGPVPEGRSDVYGPVAGSAVVEAWADDYIRFERERRPDWQERLRTEIRTRCARLEPSAGEVLHATYVGAKPPNSDVENLVLYNIDTTFKVAGRNGIRFEHGTTAPPAHDGEEYPFFYRYALAPRSGTFDHWQQGRTLASFDWIDLGAFAGGKKLAQVWLALARQVEVAEPACAPQTPFAVSVQVRPPQGSQPRWGELVKGIFDGVICAFQAHTDRSVLPDVVARLAAVLPADPVEIEELLLDQRRAVLPVVRRLVYPYQGDVKWDPADHLCVAGELLAAESVASRWAIKGRLIELSR